MGRKSASYKGLSPASAQASSAARSASKKSGTKPELALRQALWREGLRYRKNVVGLPGKPDLVFTGPRVVVFCDGDFWHGRNWRKRRAKLARGANPKYWVAKIERNMARDREIDRKLATLGWRVVRVWESEVLEAPEKAVERVRDAIRG